MVFTMTMILTAISLAWLAFWLLHKMLYCPGTSLFTAIINIDLSIKKTWVFVLPSYHCQHHSDPARRCHGHTKNLIHSMLLLHFLEEKDTAIKKGNMRKKNEEIWKSSFCKQTSRNQCTFWSISDKKCKALKTSNCTIREGKRICS